MRLSALEGVRFDMDGILVDSEPFWRQAEMELFATVGLNLSDQDCAQTTGLRIDEVVAIRHAEQPWEQPSQAELARAIVERVQSLVREQAQRLPGVERAIQLFEARGLPVGLASSSSSKLIATTLEALDLERRFVITHSAEGEDYGKPHPAVYLNACRLLGTDPTRTLAIEDSLNGVIAAKAARMPVVAIPAEHDRADQRFLLADRVLGSLDELPATLST